MSEQKNGLDSPDWIRIYGNLADDRAGIEEHLKRLFPEKPVKSKRKKELRDWHVELRDPAALPCKFYRAHSRQAPFIGSELPFGFSESLSQYEQPTRGHQMSEERLI